MIINLGSNREEFALGLLEQFKNKLHNAIQSSQEKPEKPTETVEEEDDDWYNFKLNKYYMIKIIFFFIKLLAYLYVTINVYYIIQNTGKVIPFNFRRKMLYQQKMQIKKMMIGLKYMILEVLSIKESVN